MALIKAEKHQLFQYTKIFVFTMVFLNQHQIQEYRNKRAKLFTADQQNNLWVPPTLVLCNNSGSG